MPAARRRRLRDVGLDAALLRPGRRPVRAGPAARRDRVHLPAERPAAARARVRPRAGAGPRARPSERGRRHPSTGRRRTGLVARAQASETASDDLLGSFEALEAQASFDRVLFDGGEFGTGHEIGSAEEQDYLGIPGLLDPDQVSTLLRQRQSEHSARRRRAGGDHAVEAARPVATMPPRTARSRPCARSSTASWPRGRVGRVSRTGSSTRSCAAPPAVARWPERASSRSSSASPCCAPASSPGPDPAGCSG